MALAEAALLEIEKSLNDIGEVIVFPSISRKASTLDDLLSNLTQSSNIPFAQPKKTTTLKQTRDNLYANVASRYRNGERIDDVFQYISENYNPITKKVGREIRKSIKEEAARTANPDLLLYKYEGRSTDTYARRFRALHGSRYGLNSFEEAKTDLQSKTKEIYELAENGKISKEKAVEWLEWSLARDGLRYSTLKAIVKSADKNHDTKEVGGDEMIAIKEEKSYDYVKGLRELAEELSEREKQIQRAKSAPYEEPEKNESVLETIARLRKSGLSQKAMYALPESTREQVYAFYRIIGRVQLSKERPSHRSYTSAEEKEGLSGRLMNCLTGARNAVYSAPHYLNKGFDALENGIRWFLGARGGENSIAEATITKGKNGTATAPQASSNYSVSIGWAGRKSAVTEIARERLRDSTSGKCNGEEKLIKRAREYAEMISVDDPIPLPDLSGRSQVEVRAAIGELHPSLSYPDLCNLSRRVSPNTYDLDAPIPGNATDIGHMLRAMGISGSDLPNVHLGTVKRGIRDKGVPGVENPTVGDLEGAAKMIRGLSSYLSNHGANGNLGRLVVKALYYGTEPATERRGDSGYRVDSKTAGVLNAEYGFNTTKDPKTDRALYAEVLRRLPTPSIDGAEPENEAPMSRRSMFGYGVIGAIAASVVAALVYLPFADARMQLQNYALAKEQAPQGEVEKATVKRVAQTPVYEVDDVLNEFRLPEGRIRIFNEPKPGSIYTEPRIRGSEWHSAPNLPEEQKGGYLSRLISWFRGPNVPGLTELDSPAPKASNR